MLEYKLVSETNEKKIYEFYPEGNKSKPGKIALYANGEREMIQESSDDIKRYYAGHAFAGIDQTKESGTVAWY